MAISTSMFRNGMEDRWNEIEKMSLAAAKAGLDRAGLERQRKEAWERLQREENLRWGFDSPRDPPRVTKQVEEELLLHIQQMEMKQKALAAEAAARMAKMNTAAMLCSITDGVNLWASRWGDGWVADADIRAASAGPDAFDWFTLRTRLHGLHRLEQHSDFSRIVT